MKASKIEKFAASDLHKVNGVSWDSAATARYSTELSSRAAALKRRETSFLPVEIDLLHKLARRSRNTVHLQCADGRDTMSLRLLGSQHATGVDISQTMIDLAHRMSVEAEIDGVAWFCCDVLESPATLDRTFDLVYTGKGALMWMLDIDQWARAVSELMEPGGTLVVYDLHPVVALFRQDGEELTGTGIDYFDYVNATKEWPVSYTGEVDAEVPQLKFERLWTIGAVLTALCDVGLRILRVSEYPEAYWESFPNLPENERARLPKTFSVVADKPV